VEEEVVEALAETAEEDLLAVTEEDAEEIEVADHSVVTEEDAEIEKDRRCLTLFAAIAEMNAKYLSNQAEANRCFAAIVSEAVKAEEMIEVAEIEIEVIAEIEEIEMIEVAEETTKKDILLFVVNADEISNCRFDLLQIELYIALIVLKAKEMKTISQEVAKALRRRLISLNISKKNSQNSMQNSMQW
jgi:hypothetical protein